MMNFEFHLCRSTSTSTMEFGNLHYIILVLRVFLFQMHPASLSPSHPESIIDLVSIGLKVYPLNIIAADVIVLTAKAFNRFPDDDRRRNPARFRYATGTGIFQPQPTDINERECWWLSETEGFFLWSNEKTKRG